ncbi:MAG: bifunctional DNA primase/polymerase [Ignavibacteriaceae bacterium]
MLNNARFYSSLGMNVIPCNYKFPTVSWINYTKQPTPDAPSLFDWDVNSIAAISGVNDYTVLDFDKADMSHIDDILRKLKLPADYPWTVESGSGKGFHIWFRFKRTDSFLNKFGDKSWLLFYPKNSAVCNHAELRLRNCYTILPPSSHVSGLEYCFRNAEPEHEPPYIDQEIMEKFIFDNFVFTPSSINAKSLKTNPVKLKEYEINKLSSAVQYLAENLGEGCYPVWNKLGLALCSLGKEGYPFFLTLSNNPKYKDDEKKIEKHFHELLRSYNGSIAVGSVFYTARQYGWTPPFSPFWTVVKNKVNFDYNKYINFLSDNNFSRMFFNGIQYFCYTDGYFINFVNEIFFKDYVYLFIKNLPEYSDESKKNTAIVLDSIIKNPFLFKKDTLEFLPSLDSKIQTDKEKEGYFFFKNCYLKITPDDLETLGYETLESHIYSERVIKKNFRLSGDTICDFETFCMNICDKDSERFDALRSSLGYLLHTFKNPVTAKAVVFTDENLSEGAAGRSGKSLLAKSLGYIRNLVEIDGKNFQFHDRFAYQRVTPASEIVLFNDVEKNFAFEKLYNIISDSFTIQKKNHSEFILPFSESPKLVITNNLPIRNNDFSTKARLFEIEFSSYYNIFRTPYSEFKKRFFDSWEEEEWNSFFTFMAGCVKYYLKYGLHEYSFINLMKKKIINATCLEFFEFMEQYLIYNEYISKPKFLNDFKEAEPSFGELKSNTFFKWVKYYASVYNYTYQEKRMDQPQVRHFAINRQEEFI